MHHANFVHLHVHSYYSLLDGAAPIEALAARAKELRMPALAITDHGNLFGAIEFYQTMSRAGVKPCIGAELYLMPRGSRLARDPGRQGELTHITLLCKNREGYRNLCRLISSSYLEGFYYKPRIDLDILRENSKGLIALTGCLKGWVSRELAAGRIKEAKGAVEELSSIFIDNRLFLEIQDHFLPDQERVNRGLIELARETGIGLCATNDVHYIGREDAEAHDALLCIQTGKNLDEPDRMRLGSQEFYLKSPDQMAELFSECPEAVSNTVAIAERLNLEFDFKTYHFPRFVPPEGQDLAGYLEARAREGLEKRLEAVFRRRAEGREELRAGYEARLEEEIKVISKMGFAGYFLIVADFIGYARSVRLPVGPGRGSAAGSLTAYCLGITNIDPIENGLIFERFLNPERISMPDVDIDFCKRRRGEVIEYVAKKYGNVGQIITFGKMKARAVVRDVGRVLAMPYAEVDRIAKLIPATVDMTLDQALKIEPRLSDLARKDQRVARMLSIAKALEGFPRHASTHAAGVVISDQPLTEFLPLYRGSNDEVVTQFDMKAVEKMGLIKFDFLGLKTLTVIEDAVRLVEERTGERLEIDSVPLDDPQVFAQLSAGDTQGVFQLESSGMTDLVMKLAPTAFEDVVALVALFRPGPLGSGMVDDFINRKHGRTPIRHILPQLEPILRETYGVILYQEQVMKIANLLASYSLGEADLLRRAMGKKKPEEMQKQRERFVTGSVAGGLAKAKAEQIFDLMAKFADYGFNKSHSAAYAMVAYQTAYLKARHPTEFMAALLTSEKDVTDKILAYMNDCRSHGIKVLPPDVNESGHDFSVVGDLTIRFGLAAVKNVGDGAIESVVQARSEGGPFGSLFGFCERVDTRRANRRVIESLIKCGAFDSSGAPRAAMLAALDTAMEIAASRQRDRHSGQARLFDMMPAGARETPEPDLPDVSEWGERQMLAYEKESLGFYITGHPLAQYEAMLGQYATFDTATLSEAGDGTEVRFGGVVSKLREITTRRGDRMCFATVEDLKGSVEVVVFSDLFADCSQLLKGDRPLLVVGTADADGENVKVVAKEIMPLDDAPQRLTRSVHFFLSQPEVTEHHLAQLKIVISRFPGGCPAFVHLVIPERTETVLALPEELKLSPVPQLVADVDRLFGHSVTRFMS
ncbi:MAG: DNA polymerase III subunit alpha [Proteobacteria bacterium]|nr:DNA polymerase III subunit alpha [Pseudomonadota bacterium]